MKIAIVTQEFPPLTQYSGGIGFHFAATARELARQGHDVRVLTFAAAAAPHRTEWEGVDVTLASAPSRVPVPTRVGWALGVDRWLARQQVDVVFAPEWAGEGAFASGRADRAPLVTNLATSLRQIRAIEAQPLGFAARVKDPIQHWLERRQAERSAGILACTTSILSWARELWGLDGVPAVALPNFVDAAAIRERARGPLPDGWPEGGPVVLYFGRLERRKGVHVLADAIPQIREALPGAQFVFIGADGSFDGRPMSDVVIERVGRHADAVHLLGPMPPERLLPAVAAADVVAFPSLWENFSIAAVEARALGRPIVATSGNGFDDFVIDGVDGTLVPPSNDAELADAITRLLGDPTERERLGSAAAAATDALSPERVVRSYVEFFETVAR